MICLLKVKVLKKNFCAPHYCPTARPLSLSRMSTGASCWKAGAMCSLRPLMSWPEAASLAILWASLSCLVRGLSPVFTTSKLNTSAFFVWLGCFCVRCWASELRWSFARIWASWLLILAWAPKPVSPLYLITSWHRSCRPRCSWPPLASVTALTPQSGYRHPERSGLVRMEPSEVPLSSTTFTLIPILPHSSFMIWLIPFTFT